MPSDIEAARFLTQATFGANDESLSAIQASGLNAWFNSQVSTPQTLLQPVITAAGNAENNNITNVLDSAGFQKVWWPQVVTAPDQLRQRAAFALSEIFVVSMVDVNKYSGIGIASYYDMLGRDAFGNFRTLLQDVTLHPMMGAWLSWANNHKETLDSSGNIIREPDENYARESMQLFTIGLVQLNPDGSSKLDSNGSTIPTYSHTDIYGIARVLTGWANDNSQNPKGGLYYTAPSNYLPMVPSQPQNHSISAKTFLGVNIAAVSSATASEMSSELNLYLDTLFNHPNLPPFIARQLIQRLVTSNPSPAYVSRVAAAFINDGNGVRGNMQAVFHAVLFDVEARTASSQADPAFGKLREPLLRMTNFERAFPISYENGNPASLAPYGGTGDPSTSLDQNPMLSPSVFNFFAPGYIPSNSSALGSRNITAPEFQITDQQSVVGYQNWMRAKIASLFGNTVDYTTELKLVESDNTVPQLTARLNLLLMGGRMPDSLASDIDTAVTSIVLKDPASSAKGVDERNRRVWTAIYLCTASPEFIVQK